MDGGNNMGSLSFFIYLIFFYCPNRSRATKSRVSKSFVEIGLIHEKKPVLRAARITRYYCHFNFRKMTSCLFKIYFIFSEAMYLQNFFFVKVDTSRKIWEATAIDVHNKLVQSTHPNNPHLIIFIFSLFKLRFFLRFFL